MGAVHLEQRFEAISGPGRKLGVESEGEKTRPKRTCQIRHGVGT